MRLTEALIFSALIFGGCSSDAGTQAGSTTDSLNEQEVGGGENHGKDGADGSFVPDPQDAEVMLAEIAKLAPPAFDPAKGSDEEYTQNYLAKANQIEGQRAALILKLFERHPDHPKVSELMPQRWAWLERSQAFQTVYEETSAILGKGDRSPLAVEAAHARAAPLGTEHTYRVELFLPAVEQFATLAPTDDRVAALLLRAAQYGTEEFGMRRKLYERILSDYSDSFYARTVPGKLRQLESIGKPFELSFVEVRSGERLSMSDLKGKVVAIDFWATWCGPCLTAMPHLKELYARYKNEGFEIIGVSLDLPKERGGLEALLKFCEDEKIDWPQYYQGQKYDSKFSSSWGINSIPAVFLVDRDGKLHSVDARDKLDQMIPELLNANR